MAQRILNASPDIGSKRDLAYEQLWRLLTLQQIPQGRRLRETEWAEKLGVSRTSLREAFVRLEAEGLIESGPKTGYFVPTLSAEDLKESVTVRMILEGGAIDLICAEGRHTRENLRPLEEACDQLERLVSEGYLLSVVEADRRYHEALVAAAGNYRLTSVYRRAPAPIVLPEILTGPVWEATMRRTVEDHRAILSALCDGDAELAKNLLRIHVVERCPMPHQAAQAG